MSKRTIGLVLIILGAALALLSLAADALGIGSYPGINWAQLAGIAVGVVAALLGAWLFLSQTNPRQ